MFISNIKLYSIISSCDRFYIKVYIFAFLNTPNVVEVDYGEEVDEYANATSSKTISFSILLVLAVVRKSTCNLCEE